MLNNLMISFEVSFGRNPPHIIARKFCGCCRIACNTPPDCKPSLNLRKHQTNINEVYSDLAPVEFLKDRAGLKRNIAMGVQPTHERIGSM
jgi:hypothetical protein